MASKKIKCQVIECIDTLTVTEDYLLNGCGVRLHVCVQHREILSVPEKISGLTKRAADGLSDAAHEHQVKLVEEMKARGEL